MEHVFVEDESIREIQWPRGVVKLSRPSQSGEDGWKFSKTTEQSVVICSNALERAGRPTPDAPSPLPTPDNA